MPKETWFKTNSKAISFFTGVLLILIAVALYVFAPTRAGTDASGQGFILPFVIVLAVIGLLLIPSPVHEIAKAYFKNRGDRNQKPPGGTNAAPG